MPTLLYKKKLYFFISLVLVLGFILVNLFHHFISISTLRKEIVSSSLPLTSDNIYSEFQRELIQPILISSLMAHDTFLRDWVIAGEKNTSQIEKYLNEILTKYSVFTSFFVSEKTRLYYHADGVLKNVDENQWRDAWYFRVRQQQNDYEINLDPDLANDDTLTIFINHRVFDYDHNFIGAAGVGLKASALISLMHKYSEQYQRHIMFVDSDGNIMFSSAQESETGNIKNIIGIQNIAETILSSEQTELVYKQQQTKVLVNSRFISELDWYLLVEQQDPDTNRVFTRTLFINLTVSLVITLLVLLLVIMAINTFQKAGEQLQTKILQQHQELDTKNTELVDALDNVKKLSGLLPICAGCKKIRDENQEWQPLEKYISEHSEAAFSHGLCPSCISKHYGDMMGEES